MKRYLKYALEIFSKNKGMFLITIFIVTISIILSLATFYVYNVASKLSLFLQDTKNISVLFDPKTPQDQLQAFIEEIKKYPQVKKVYQKPPEEILRDYLPGDYPIPKEDLVKIVRIEIKKNADPTPIVNSIRQERNANENIIEIIYLPDFYQRLISLSKWVNIISAASFVIFLLISFSLIYLTLELGLQRLQTEIQIMRNIGASFNTIFIPLMINTTFTVLLSGFLSGLTILGVLVPLKHVLNLNQNLSIVSNLLQNLGLASIFNTQTLLVVLLTIIFMFIVGTGIFTYFIVHRFLNKLVK